MCVLVTKLKVGKKLPIFACVFQSIQEESKGTLFRVKYEDGDSEDLSYEELKPLVTPSDIKAHLDAIRKHDIRTWMSGKKTKSKKSTATKQPTSEAQVIDMTCNSEETSRPVKPVKPVEAEQQDAKPALSDQHQVESSPKEQLQQPNAPSAKNEDAPPTSVVAFFARTGGNDTVVPKNANSEV